MAARAAIQQEAALSHRVPPSTTAASIPSPVSPVSINSSPLPSSPCTFIHQIPFHELHLSEVNLGSGSYGIVYKGLWRTKTVAVKKFNCNQRSEINSFTVEVQQLSHVGHENIIKLYGSSTSLYAAYLVMEYAEGGSLNHLLHECKHQDYDLSHACSWAMQTARGVAYLHGIRPKPIVHRDLKPGNLLLFRRGRVLKICDFGTACMVKTEMTSNTGSASYMAPEVFATKSYHESCDVYSWGIIFWEILARRRPYEEYSVPFTLLWHVKEHGVRPHQLESCPGVIWNLITRSWHKKPDVRPTMSEIAQMMKKIFSLTSDRHRAHHHHQASSPKHQHHQPGVSDSSRHHQHHHHNRSSPSSHPFQQSDSVSLQEVAATSSAAAIEIEFARKNLRLHSRRKGLYHRISILSTRAREIEAAHEIEITNPLDLIEELERLKLQTESKKRKLSSNQFRLSQRNFPNQDI